MLWLYRLLFLPVLLVLAPYYLWRMRRRGGYGEDFGQRLGAVPALPPKRVGVRRMGSAREHVVCMWCWVVGHLVCRRR